MRNHSESRPRLRLIPAKDMPVRRYCNTRFLQLPVAMSLFAAALATGMWIELFIGPSMLLVTARAALAGASSELGDVDVDGVN